MHPNRSAEAAQIYFTQGLTREDYYIDGQEIAGRWGGRGAAMLGLGRDPVERRPFVALTENRHPATGKRLTLRVKADRTVAYDMNFHAPKGVSLMHALGGDERIMTAFREAVDATMHEIEQQASTRVRKGGVYDDRVTGNLAWAEFVHLTARPSEENAAPDPQLHAHCFVFNATFDPVEQVWKAGQFRDIKRDAPYFEAAFHARLALGLRALGYRTERTPKGWDIANLPRALIEKYSNRTADIERVARALGITDPVAKGRLGARTRKAKDKSRTIPDLTAEWEARMTPAERKALDAAKPSTPSPAAPPADDEARRDAARRAMDEAIAHTFERRSSERLKRLVGETLRAGFGEVDVDAAWREAEARPLLRRTVRGDVLVTTNEVLREEQALLAYAVDGKGVCAPVRERIAARKGEAWTPTDERLSADQRRAVDHVLDSKDRVLAIRGVAGTGKTTMMREAVAAIRAGGQPVVVVAPTADAARGQEGLRSKGFASADTVAKLLQDPRLQQGLSNGKTGGVLWVDEAGLLGAQTMRQLFDLAEKHKARVVLCGDERQHKPVERGDALRVLEKLGGVTSVELASIRRQRGAYRAAVQALANEDLGKAVANLERMDAFHEVKDPAARIRAAAMDYVETVAAGKTAAVISPTHAEGGAVAAEIRRLQRERGELTGEDRVFTRLRDTGWTEAQRAEASRYEPGQVAHFHQHAKGVVAGDRCAILGPTRDEHGDIVVRATTPRGVEINLPLGDADRFQVYHKESIHIAVGDRIRVTRNGRAAEKNLPLTNGATHLVTGFTKHGAMVFEGGGTGRPKRVVPKEYGHLAYGSVSTSHAAQGRDVQRVILCQGAFSATAASAEQFYVSVSRGKESIAIYTDDKDQLISDVRRSAERLGGIELMRDKDPSLVAQRRVLRDVARRMMQNSVAPAMKTRPTKRSRSKPPARSPSNTKPTQRRQRPGRSPDRER